MQPLDPRADFRDDGGAPAWRMRLATPIYDAAPAGLRGFRYRLRRVAFPRMALFIALWGFLGAPVYFVGALLLAYGLDLPDDQGWIPATIWGGVMLAIFASSLHRFVYSRTGR